jgi:hypothetical protein
MMTITDRRTAIFQGGLLAADTAMAAACPAGATDARGGPLRDALNGAWQLVAAERKITFLRQTDNFTQNGYRLGAALLNSAMQVVRRRARCVRSNRWELIYPTVTAGAET